MVLAMRRAGFPADISDAPGTLMCNHLMCGVLHHIAANGLPIRAGWIHLPSLHEVAAMEHEKDVDPVGSCEGRFQRRILRPRPAGDARSAGPVGAGQAFAPVAS